MNFKDKVVLITGGAKGIGKEIAKAYAKEGARVIIADLDYEAGIKAEEHYSAQGLDVVFYAIDLKKPDLIVTMFGFIMNKYGKIDILINNAGLSRFKSIYETTIEEWDEILNVNLRAIFVASKEFAIHMRNKGGGRIVNISSTRYLMSEPGSEAYAASKGGIVSLTHALALSLSKDKITVNCISPGWIETRDYDGLREIDHKQHPSMRVGRPEDIANACLFLTSNHNDFINGQNIIIDGGMTKKMIYEQ
jgi:NAD(P)-dependent dehydrogenase (short-subunit alcohol dehydrogenase family)